MNLQDYGGAFWSDALRQSKLGKDRLPFVPGQKKCPEPEGASEAGGDPQSGWQRR